jgi:hypothetical protein
MATLAEPVPSQPCATPAARSRFYLWLSLACLAIGVGGFAPTYWLQVPAGTFTGTPLMHIHALVFTGWLVLLVGQNWRIAQGRVDRHRAWGLGGIALATAMLVIGFVTAIAGLGERLEQGYGDNARSFLIVPLFSVTVFYGFVIAAIANLRRPEWHKRFIFVATAIALMPAVARMLIVYRQGFEPGVRPGNFPPLPVNGTLLQLSLACLPIIAGMIYDWRTRGRPHPAWVIGLGVLLIGGVFRGPLSETSAWQAFADWTTRIAG